MTYQSSHAEFLNLHMPVHAKRETTIVIVLIVFLLKELSFLA